MTPFKEQVPKSFTKVKYYIPLLNVLRQLAWQTAALLRNYKFDKECLQQKKEARYIGTTIDTLKMNYQVSIVHSLLLSALRVNTLVL